MQDYTKKMLEGCKTETLAAHLEALEQESALVREIISARTGKATVEPVMDSQPVSENVSEEFSEQVIKDVSSGLMDMWDRTKLKTFVGGFHLSLLSGLPIKTAQKSYRSFRPKHKWRSENASLRNVLRWLKYRQSNGLKMTPESQYSLQILEERLTQVAAQ